MIDPNSPSASLLMPALKYSVFASPLLPLPERDAPQARVAQHLAVLAGDRAEERAADGIERVDLRQREAEVADQQVAAEAAEADRRDRETPRRCELAARDQRPDQVAAGVEDRDGARSRARGDLVGATRRRVGHVGRCRRSSAR